MESSSCGLFATYNTLHPFYAVKWAAQEGLNEKGKALSSEELKASTISQDPNAWKQYSNWDLRCGIVAENIQYADIVCLQEVALDTIQKLRELTESKGYRLAIAAYHASSQPVQQFGNAILYNAEKAKLQKAFEIVHGTGEKSRSAACGIFQMNGKVIAVASMHLAGYFKEQTDLVKKQASKQAGFDELNTYVEALERNVEGVEGIVIGADYNEDLREEGVPLYRRGFLRDRGYRFDGNDAPTEGGSRLDDVCYKPIKGTVRLASMGLESIQKIGSDHLMTGIVAQFDP